MRASTVSVLFLLFISGCSTPTGRVSLESVPSEAGSLSVFFCPHDDCEGALLSAVNSSKESVHCAFFDLDLPSLITLLGDKSKNIDVKLVIDEQNYGAVIGENVKKDDSSQYSHNKFCVIDGKIVTTGSMNPTNNDAHKNNNNLLVIGSRYLARNHEDEFSELWELRFGEGERVRYPEAYLNGIHIENYFCPEDKCSEKIIERLSKAEKSIYFMQFSFTDEGIADAMLFNKKAEVIGIFEKRDSAGKYSQYKRLSGFGLDVFTDSNPYNMHNKVFIVDNQTVITGSMNPSSAGNHKNDENILIIDDESIALEYTAEFFRLLNNASGGD
ncbi:MAG TPA: phospholipase D-like domain-containing protein [Candidatus Nanoarchaeia archaeon]|nr:phospholipase D-like domain-containing protein [Candidatus Nanoarchaeia archaeon]